MKTLTMIALAATAALFPLAAAAAPDCTDAPRAQWMPAGQMKARIVADGYRIDRFQVSGQCYEIYGRDRDGTKVEIYFDPTDGRIVKRKEG